MLPANLCRQALDASGLGHVLARTHIPLPFWTDGEKVARNPLADCPLHWKSIGLKHHLRDVDRSAVERRCCGLNPVVQSGLVRSPRWAQVVETILERLWPRILDYPTKLDHGLDEGHLAPPRLMITCKQGRHRSVVSSARFKRAMYRIWFGHMCNG